MKTRNVKPHTLLIAALLTLSFAAAGLGYAENHKSFPSDWFWGEPDQQAEHEAMVGKEPPPLYLTDWHGKKMDLDQLKGKVVLIDVWATWCGPCLAAIPHNNELLEKYGDKGLVIIGVCNTDGADTMAKVAKEKGMKYPTAKDVDKKTEKAWNVHWWPTYALIDRSGIVRAVGLQTSYVEDAVKALLKEKAPEGIQESKSDDTKPAA